MKLILQKADNFKETNKVIEILSTDINNNVDTYFIKSNETLIIKYSDTEEQFLIKDIQSNIVYDNNSETLVTISDVDLLPLGGGGGGTLPSYKVYTALLTQSGTDDPVATVLENTLGGTVVWTRISGGQYRATLTGVFIENKTFILTGSNINTNNVDSATLNTVGLSIDSFVLNTFDTYTQVFDEILLNTSIEIRVYN